MTINSYLKLMNELQSKFLDYIDNSDVDIQNFTNFYEANKIDINYEYLKDLFHLILKVANNHHRSPIFFVRIEQVLLYFKENIKQSFSNEDISKIFKNNKQILLLLIKNRIILPTKSICKYIINKNRSFYSQFLYPEIMPFIDSEIKKSIEEENKINFILDFDEKRQIGENDSYICTLIRKDLIDEFIVHVNRTNISLNSIINQSIFETNNFLLTKTPTLIEYASFFGSIQIFQYLRFNQVEMDPDLWLYAIHSNNAEMIHLLEEISVQPPNDSFELCLEEAIKCHHNEIANYIMDALLDVKMKDEFYENTIECSFRYYNYAFFPQDLHNNKLFFYINKYNYNSILNHYINEKGENEIKLQSANPSIESAESNNNIDNLYYLLSKQSEKYAHLFDAFDKLTQIVIPSSITKIEKHAFDNYLSLQEIIIPSSVTKIESYSFNECKSLKEIKIPSSVKSIGCNSFCKCWKLQKVSFSFLSSLKTIGSYAFYECLSIKQMLIPSSVEEIGERCFNYCSSLIQINLPSSIKYLGQILFEQCTSLDNVILPSSLNYIPYFCFLNCTNLKHVSIPSSITTIKWGAFNKCSSLKEVFIPFSVERIENFTFCQCSSLVKITIPPFVKMLDENVFDDCLSLKEIMLPNSIKTKFIARNGVKLVFYAT